MTTYNKVVFGDDALIDLTGDTVTPETLAKGATAHDRSGAAIVGEFEGGTDTDDATADAGDMLEGATAYSKGEKITGTIPTVEVAAASIEVDENGNITATVEQSAGYIAADASKVSTIEQTKVEAATPSIEFDSTGKITATTEQAKGFTDGGTKQATKQLEAVDAATPSISVDANGKITATTSQAAGFTAGGNKSATLEQTKVDTPTPSISANGANVVATVEQSAGYTAGGTKSASYSIPTVAQAVPSIAFSGATVIATAEQGAGYVAAGTKSISAAIPTATQATPVLTVDNATGAINATATQSAGYVAAGTKSSSKQLPTQAGGTITPNKSQQQAIASGAFALGSVMVEAIPSAYIQPSGTSEITANGVYDVAAFSSASVNVVPWDNIAMRSLSGIVILSESRVYPHAFQENNNITGISAPSLKQIDNEAFRQCGIKVLSLASLTSIGINAFASCVNLITVNCPNLKTISASAFFSCASLMYLDARLVEYIGVSAFFGCNKITKANFSYLTNVGNDAFFGCSSLSTVTFGNVSAIGNRLFASCINLISLYLTRVTSVPPLYYSTIFTSSPIGGYSNVAGQYGSIYVPASLYESFKTANNWSYFADRFVSV